MFSAGHTVAMVTYHSIFDIMTVASMDRVVIMTIKIYILESAVLNRQIVNGLYMACHNSVTTGDSVQAFTTLTTCNNQMSTRRC